MPTYYGVKFPDIPKKKANTSAAVSAAAAAAATGGVRMPDRVVPVTPTPTQMPDRVVPTPIPGAPPVYLPTPLRGVSQPVSAVPPHTPQTLADTRFLQLERMGQAIYGPSYRSPLLPEPVSAVPPVSPRPYVSGAGPDTRMAQMAREFAAAGLPPSPDFAPLTPREVEHLRAFGRGEVDISGMPLQPPPSRISGAGPDVILAQQQLPAPPPAVRRLGDEKAWQEEERLRAGLGSLWRTVRPVVEPVLGALGTGLLGVAEAINLPYRTITQPYYVGVRQSEYNRLLEEAARLDTAMRSGQVSADRIPAYQARLAELGRQMEEIRRRQLNPLTAFRELRATPEQVAEFERTAPWWEQLAAGAILDPLNLVSLGGGRLLQAARMARAERALRPVARSVDEVAAAMRTEGLYGKGVGRFLPWRLTNTAQKEALVNESVDWVNLVTRNLPGDPFDNLEQFIRDPDSLARATGGVTASLPAKQSVALLREVLRDPASGSVSFATLRKIVSKAKGDRLQAIADLARKFDDAAQTFFPAQPRSAPYRLRDWLYGWLSVGHLGLNPGYAVRNAASNTIISLMDGFLPFTSAGTITDFWRRWGGMPVMAKAGITTSADVWRAKRTAIDFIQSLERAEGARGLVQGLGEEPLRIASTFSGNIERAFSEQITYQGTLRAWKPLWEWNVRIFRERLRAAGIPEDVIDYMVARAYRALSPEEIREAARRLTGQAPAPTGGTTTGAAAPSPAAAAAAAAPSPAAAVPAPPAAAVHPRQAELDAIEEQIREITAALATEKDPSLRQVGQYAINQLKEQRDEILATPTPVSTTEQIARRVAAAQTPGFPFSVPVNIQEEIARVFGQTEGRRIVEIIEAAGSNEARTATLDIIDEIINLAAKTAEHASQIDTLGQVSTDVLRKNADNIIRFMRNEAAILADARAAHDAALEKVWRASRSLVPEERARVWEPFWEQLQRDIRITHEKLDDLERGIMPNLGFSPEAVQRGIARRAEITKVWEQYAERLRKTWEQSARLTDPGARDGLWREFKEWAREHWDAENARAQQFAAQREVDITEALTRGGGAPAAPVGEAAPPPAGPLPQEEIRDLLRLVPEEAAPAQAPIPSVVVPDDNELRRLASQAGIATITKKGVPYDRHLVNAINKDLGIKITRLSELTDEQRRLAAEALQRRSAPRSAPPSLDVPPGIIWHPLSIQAVWNAFAQPARNALAKLRAAAALPPQPLTTLTPDLVKALDDEVNQLVAGMIRAKATAQRVGVAWRNAVLGDYARRRNLHDWIGWLFMYPSWYLFTYPNMALRFAAKPAFLSNYARYRALLERENERYWQQEIKTGRVPPRYANMVRINTPWGVQFFQLERLINPINNLLDTDFTTRELQQTPDWVQAFRKLGDWGPALSSPLTWMVAALIAKDHPVAARQLVGYQTAITRPIKDLTAYLRERLPILEGIVPPGGLVIEAPINPAVRAAVPPGRQASPFYGGDYWSERRIAMFLEAMVASGEITEEEAQDAAAKRWGPIWDRAKQAEAIANLPATLRSFFGGPAMRGRSPEQARLEAMDAEWFDLRQRAQTMTPDERRKAYDEFFNRWQTYDLIRLARTNDPLQRLSEYTWMVIDRIPYGYRRRRAFEEAGIADLMDKFYAARGRIGQEPAPTDVRGGPLEGGVYPVASVQWTDEEIERLAQGIDALAKRFRIPSPTETAEWERAREIHEAKQMRALALLQGERGQYFTLDAIRRMEAAYYSLPDEMREEYLQNNPVLRRWWDLLDEAERALTPEELQAERALYESPEAARSRMIWEESLPPGGNWRRGLLVPSFVEDLYDETKRATMSDADLERALAWLQANVPEKYMQPEEWKEARRLNEEFQAQARAEFGDDIIDLAAAYGKLSTAERRRWRSANPDLYALLKDYWDFKREFGDDNPVWDKYYGFEEGQPARGGRSYRRGRRGRRSYRSYRGRYGGGALPEATPVPGAPGVPGVPPRDQAQYTALLAEMRADPAFDPLAKLLFGSDIFDLLARWFAMTPEEQAAFMQQNQALYERILRFLAWLAAGAGRGATRALQSIPGGSVNATLPTLPTLPLMGAGA